jgi:N-acetyl-anhydromuramyl-L-alanine amidase AmpD
MKHLISLIFLSILFIGNIQSQNLHFTAIHDYDTHFQEAYQTYPNIPVGILEAISYTQTHIKDVNRSHTHSSCAGIPHYYGVMGLIKDGKGWFNNNLDAIAIISNIDSDIIQSSPRENILAYAKAYSILLQQKNITNPSPDAHLEILNDLSELPNDSSIGSDFAFDTYLYSVFSFLDNKAFRIAYKIPDYHLSLPHIFGTENYHVLSSCQITASQDEVTNENGSHYNGNVVRNGGGCTDTNIPVIYTAADASNYSSRNGDEITHVTIHTMQGSYSGSISWFQNPSANVSAHYNIRSSDGQITQMVCEFDKAWHVGNSNSYTVGIEHEGFVDDATWYTENLYQASASIAADICDRNSIPRIRTYDVNGDSGLNPLSDGCYKVKGHQHFPNQSHTDPGQYWDWNRFYDLLNPSADVNIDAYTSCIGTFQDSGENGNYDNDEREFYLIQPAGESTITLNFTAFDLETNFDYLYVYDGDSYNDSLIATLNGTTLPPDITAYSGAMFLEFRTDCGTNSTGWTANWSCGSSNDCGIPSNLSQSNESINEVNFSWDAVAGVTDYTFRIKRNIENTWEYHSTSSNSISIGGLAVDGYYIWGVSTNCSNAQSPYNGTEFINTGFTVGSTISTNCSGIFTDTGGDLANYQNSENLTYTIAPTDALFLTLNFTTFDVEADYDFMKIYDGSNTSALLIGTYSGTTSPGNITSSTGSLTVEFTSDSWTSKPGWTANWSCDAFDNAIPITEIGAISNWVSNDFNLGFNDVDNHLVTKKFYQVSDYDGSEWTSNANNGFFNDDFNALSTEWTSYAGTWNIDSGSLLQTDEASSNTILSASLAQNGSTEYLYHWNSNISGTGTNKRAGLHFFCDDPSSSNRGNSYFIYYRVDSDVLQIYEVNDNTFLLAADIPMTFTANINYDFKISYSPITGKIDVFVDDILAGTWTDDTPLTSGDYVSFRSGNCNYTINGFSVYQSRATNKVITIGATDDKDIDQQSENPTAVAGKVRSIILDPSNNMSNIAEKDFKVDYTAPTGLNNLVGTATNGFTITGSWNTSNDPHSGIDYYEYSIGTTAGGTNIFPWNNNGMNTNFTETGLSLVSGQDYYLNVRATNAAGLSEMASSTSFPYISTSNTTLLSAVSHVNIFPNPAKDILHIEYNSLENANIQIMVIDVSGKIIHSQSKDILAGQQFLDMDISNWSSGYYLLHISNGLESMPVKFLKL